ncbi:MAG: CBS domain-containing protein [Fimbriimonas ginsengisoli]|uniref:CBS domain-containing protein n=1 Tax=Fimbriimonas ginsengisoli TaxID=1005039 RepID=A0A931LX21_FIMGI|nr:CBS domain-containing protein [Fimbriimonas ginsengisoli]
MNLSQVMTRNVQVVHPDTTLRDAALVMRNANIGMLPVVDGERVVGILTDRDLVVRGMAELRDPARARVRHVMTTDVVRVYEDQEMEDAIDVMGLMRVQRVVVVDRQERLLGVLSASDAAVLCHGDTRAGHLYENIAARAVVSTGV